MIGAGIGLDQIIFDRLTCKGGCIGIAALFMQVAKTRPAKQVRIPLNVYPPVGLNIVILGVLVGFVRINAYIPAGAEIERMVTPL